MFKILIAVDGSNSADRAIGAVARLAHESTQIEVSLLNVGQFPFVFPGDMADGKAPAKNPVEQHQVLDKAVALASSHGLSVRCIRASSGTVAREIVRAAEAAGADQIVMGAHGLKSNGHYVLGSVTQKVLQIASTPVLLVR